MRASKGFSLIEVITAMAILGIGAVAVFQLFSIGLGSVKKSSDYSRALIFARSLLDEALSLPDPSEASGSFESEGFRGTRDVYLISSEEGVELYGIVVTVRWPEGQSLRLRSSRMLYENEEPGLPAFKSQSSKTAPK